MYKILIIGIILINIFIWSNYFYKKDDLLYIVACDVGQGDAFLITQGSSQILVDGGEGNKVMDCLSNNIPFWDRKIDLIISTHPETDHSEGLIKVLGNYYVDTFMGLSVDSSSKNYQLLKNIVGGSGAKVINPTEETTVRLGLIYLDVVWPSKLYMESLNLKYDESQDVLGSWTTEENLNNLGIVFKLKYMDFDGLFTADILPEVIDDILESGEIKEAEYLKVPHHGSKNGLTKDLLEVVSPEIAVISAGKKNRYGHPHQEILELLEQSGSQILGTYDLGEIKIVTNGKGWYRQN